MRGRIFASFDVFWQLGRLVFLLIGGLLAAAIGIQAVYLLGSLLLLAAAAIGWGGIRGRPPATDVTAASARLAHTGVMRIELLVVPNCPHENVALTRLRQSLDDAGHANTPVEVRNMTVETAAETPEFAGSPTILIDGADPFTEPAAGSAAFSCRIYHCEAGLSGAPSVEQLRQVLRR